MSEQVSCWEDVLDGIEDRVREWHAVAGGGALPREVDWPAASLPPHLVERATAALGGLREVETELAARWAALRSVLEDGRGASRPTGTPLFVDRRA